MQEKRRKAINTVRRQWEATMTSRRRGKQGSASSMLELHASHVANFPNVDTPRRDSSPERLATTTTTVSLTSTKQQRQLLQQQCL